MIIIYYIHSPAYLLQLTKKLTWPSVLKDKESNIWQKWSHNNNCSGVSQSLASNECVTSWIRLLLLVLTHCNSLLKASNPFLFFTTWEYKWAYNIWPVYFAIMSIFFQWMDWKLAGLQISTAYLHSNQAPTQLWKSIGLFHRHLSASLAKSYSSCMSILIPSIMSTNSGRDATHPIRHFISFKPPQRNTSTTTQEIERKKNYFVWMIGDYTW